MPVSNTYIEPTSGTTLNLARQQFNDSMRAVLTNFKGPNIPTSLKADDALFTDQQDGMLFRSTVTNALYIYDTANKQANNIGGSFTRFGIGPRVETTYANFSARANLTNFYETGETVVTLDTGRLYIKKGTIGNISSFADVGNPVGYTVGLNSNITFEGDSVTAERFLATSEIGINKTVPTEALDVVGSANISQTLNANTVSAASYQTFTSDYRGTSWSIAGPAFDARARTYIDISSASNATIGNRTSFSIRRPTYSAANANVNITEISTMYIQGNPIASANIVSANSYALLIDQGKMHVVLGGTATVPAISIRTPNTGLFSLAAASLDLTVLGNTVGSFSSLGRFTTPTVSGNVATSNITFSGSSFVKGDFNSTSGVTTTAPLDVIVANAYTPSPVGGNMKKLVNNNSLPVTFNAPIVAGDYTLVIQITNGTTPGAITMNGFTKVIGDIFTTVVGDDFFVYITELNGFAVASIVALQ